MENTYRITRDNEISKNIARMDKIIRNTKTLTEKELKKEADTLFAQKKFKNEALLDAFNNKKLKSKKLIRQARDVKIHQNTIRNSQKNNGGVTE